MAAVPNFDYMEEQFTTDTDKFDRTVVIMHACPYSDQFNNNVCKAFRRYLDFAPGLMCCVYGHEFWKSQPSRYPDKYYEFMSTKFRLNLALGQRITLKIKDILGLSIGMKFYMK